MSVITARGKEAKESANQKGANIDYKKVYIRLKDGESVRVRLLTHEDYVEYKAHGSYGLGIWTQPCLEPTGKRCALCEAAKTQYNDDFKNLYARKRYLFAMADIDTGELRVFDATKGQATGLIDTIEQYAEDLNEFAFTFKRIGNKTETSYILNLIPKLKADDKQKFAAFENVVVDDNFFDSVLFERTWEQQIENLVEAGFPVETLGTAPSAIAEEITPVQTIENPDSVF
ncbi:hypothetical protein Dtox_1872 [Desulfofarcimen acetoxidans DSM 771]|uniref:Bacteriophage T4 Gp32 single-stranded DNA-binding domain-containing protein n=1 Tax=Desulfofarcimen acetoxidans (strain ATCC 49208 / DSM 771 / KCTC 5769 / VKM B-1644 / 5575) TaxID=485916 RepID=C8VXR2_DESAS|nr:hypothetical protein [Desulfofarcimen acetoxidans]ACV62718.1 hypothetical protein Dtox_1872 [Desulfofarcimen acetoxidans DSM 771]